jgi:hypothetical protein
MKVTPEIVTAEKWHIPHIAAHVRDADRDEFWAASMHTPEEVLEQAFVISRLAWTGLIDGVPVCMYGVVDSSTVLIRQGRPWMVGTDLLDKHQVVFLRRCRSSLETMKMCFGKLENYIDARNVKAIQWLKWLGFSFSEPEPLGPLNMPFIRFTLGE